MQFLLVFLPWFALNHQNVQAVNPRNTPVPGLVRLENGTVLKGMCLQTSALLAEYGRQHVNHRSVDQGFRQYLVSYPRSEPLVPDETALPSLVFRIPRQNGRKPMADVIGVPRMSPIDADGNSVMELTFPGNRVEQVRLGVREINRERIEFTSTSHRHRFSMALSTVPDASLSPGLLRNAVGFEDGDIRLNMAGMLINAGRIRPASSLLDSVEESFDQLAPQVARERERLRQALASRLLTELQRQQAAGQLTRSAAAARLFPKADLTPAAQVAVQQLVQNYEDLERRVAHAKAVLQMTVDEIEDPGRQQHGREMVAALLEELDIHTIPRLDAWEFLSTDDSLSAEAQIALAVSGWLLGSDDAFQEFSEVFGLTQIRQAVIDFVANDESNSVERDHLLDSIRRQEGYSVARTAAIVRQLRPALPLPLTTDQNGEVQFELSEEVAGVKCPGRVPTDYTTGRRYPLLIAISREGVSSAATLRWWSQQAARFGFILAIPEFLPADQGTYTAEARYHRQVRQLVTALKLRLSIDDNRVFIGGHGIGGNMAMDMGSCQSDLFAGIISIAGLGRRHTLRTVHNTPEQGWYVVFGDRQAHWYSRMSPLFRKLLLRVSRGNPAPNALLVRYRERGFESYIEEAPSIFEWMSVTQRNPWPEYFAGEALRSTDLHWHWVQFDSLPARLQNLEGPSTSTETVKRGATVHAQIMPSNGVTILKMPSGGSVQISPDMPGFDPNKEFFVRTGRKRITVDWEPSVRDLLEHYANTGERERQCFMKVRFDR